MTIPVCRTNTSIKLVPWPGCRLGVVASYVSTSLTWNCAFIDWQIHRLLFDDRSASVGGLRRYRGRTGLGKIYRLGISTVIWLVGLLWVARVGLGQSSLKTLNIRLLVYLSACFGQGAISTLIGPQLRRKKCIGWVVVVAIVHWGQIGVVTIYCVWCRGLASWGKASPCIVGRVWIDVE